MAITWSALTVTDDDLEPYKALLERGIDKGKFAEATPKEIYRDIAKREMLVDLQNALGLNPQNASDMLELDEIVDLQAAFFVQALKHKQLALALKRLVRNADSLLYEDYRVNVKLYDTFKERFPGLRDVDGQANVTYNSLL